MKVDLHCHTKAIKKGEPSTRNVDLDTFVNAIKGSEVKIVAITNHNHFDLKQYEEFAEAAKDFCRVWPGVEIDVKFDAGEVGHIILVADPINAKDFSKCLEELLGSKSPNSFSIDPLALYNSMKAIKSVYLVHYDKKPKAWPDSEINKLQEALLKDDASHCLFKEPGSLRSCRIFADYGHNAIIGSDVRDWSKYSEASFSELRLPIDDFKSLVLLSKKDATVVNTLLNKKACSSIPLDIEGTRIKLPIYNDINVVFGHKGTGKSLILEKLRSEYERRGHHVSPYKGSEQEGDFDDKLKVLDEERKIICIGADDCRSEIECICEWNEVEISHISRFIKAKEDENASINKKRLGITRARLVGIPTMDEFEKLHNQYETTSEAYSSFHEIDLARLLTEVEAKTLMGLILKVASALKIKAIDEWTKQKALQLSKFSIDCFKELADKKTGLISTPTDASLYDFIKNRMELRKKAELVLSSINIGKRDVKICLGELDEHGKMYLVTRYEMFRERPLLRRFNKKYKAEDLEEFRSSYENLASGFYKTEVGDHIAKIKELKEDGLDSTESLLGVSKYICKEDRSEYKPSSGEKAILLLQIALDDKTANVYILDEPELHLGNKYIDKIIVPQINNIGKASKTIIIATHNANIAVRTLPYMSAYREHDNGKYRTYIGNPFSDQLVDFDDPRESKSWTEESMTTLEGGARAFEDRRYVYGTWNKTN